MKASYLTGIGGPDVIAFGNIPTPDPGPNDVRVSVHFAALNHLDLWVRKGLAGVKSQFPHVLCGDGSGVVESIGKNVTTLSVGDEVIVHPGVSCGSCEKCLSGWESLCAQYQILGEHRNGAAAEYLVVPAANCFKKPKNLGFKEAASVGLVFTTAWQMVVRRAQVKAGQWVLVHAAGSGVSSAAIQIAKLFGARVIATASQDVKLELAKKWGAEVVVNYTTQDFLAEVKKVTQKAGVDVVIDHVGRSIWEQNLKALRWGGTLVTCGASSGFDAATDLRQLFYRQLSLLGSTMGSKLDFPTILRHIERRELQPVIDSVFPLGEMKAAQARMERREVFGKVLLDVAALQ